MLYYLCQLILEGAAETAWAGTVSPLRVFQYITFRSAGAAITALLLSLWLGPRVIAWLKRLKFGQHYADRAEEAGGLTSRLLSKKGTPTMGGILIVLVIDLTALLWARWNALVVLTLLSMVVLAALGFSDDYVKITKHSGRGTASHVKLWVHSALALFIGGYLWWLPDTRAWVSEIMVPFPKYPLLKDAIGVGLLLTVATIVGRASDEAPAAAEAEGAEPAAEGAPAAAENAEPKKEEKKKEEKK